MEFNICGSRFFGPLKLDTHPSGALKLPVPKRFRMEREAESFASRE